MLWLKHIENTYRHNFMDLLLVFYFSIILENLYMTLPICSDLFYGGDNTINQHYQK